MSNVLAFCGRKFIKKILFVQEINTVIAKQNELKSQEAWIRSKKGHAKHFRSKERRDKWLIAEVEKMEKQLAILEGELEEVAQAEQEKKKMVANISLTHQNKSQELQEVQKRWVVYTHPKNNLILSIKTETVTVGADANVHVCFLCQTKFRHVLVHPLEIFPGDLKLFLGHCEQSCNIFGTTFAI